ncbi:nucleoside-diphosphate sugar epimerase/dehydratase [Georgenia sp. M64]|uniref:polysaccharide biosynthesis protein n=1 Tax=Georgenia sp. M64 TaxID=3120520 RepID=UPI0030E31FEE
MTMILWDALAWIGAVILVVGSRYDFALSDAQWDRLAIYTASAIVLQVGVGTLLKLYRGRYRVGSFEEPVALAASTLLVAGALGLIFYLFGYGDFPVGIAILVPPVAAMLMGAARWLYRAWGLRSRPVSPNAEPVLVYGAGDAGNQLLRLLNRDGNSPYRAVGLIDDDPAKRNLTLHGVPVLGSRSKLLETASKTDVSTVIMAISDASPELISEVSDLVEGSGRKFLLLPPVGEMIGRQVSLTDVREVEITDILGRRQVETDLTAIADYVTSKRVLITGAGGSIGSELARQVHKFGPSELILLDRDESALHAVQLSIYGKGLLDTPDMVLSDIRDKDALREIFEFHKPEVIFHAAALKHLPMLEQYPLEGWKTNVLGTLNVLDLAAEYGVGQFVNISTDKAANPTNVLGRTKRVAEELTSWYGLHADGTYLSVRFGNVLGSRGSMLHTFQRQIHDGGPLTVTHPDITRYFMTIPEACELVIQAGAIGDDGEVLVLDMGEPVKILDVAKRLITHAAKDVEIVFTGLRPNEKLHEELFGTDEVGERREHDLITHVSVPPLAPSELDPTSLGRLPGRRVRPSWHSIRVAATEDVDPDQYESATSRRFGTH